MVAIARIVRGGQCLDARGGILGVGSNAIRAAEAGSLLVGHPFDESRIDDASKLACEGFNVDSDMHFTAGDKRQLCPSLCSPCAYASLAYSGRGGL